MLHPYFTGYTTFYNIIGAESELVIEVSILILLDTLLLHIREFIRNAEITLFQSLFYWIHYFY